MDRREEILIAASELFRENGYHASSMRDLAKRVDMKGSSLYTHFKAKEEILWEIVSKGADAFLRSAESIDQALNAKDKLECLIQGHFDVMTNELTNATVFFNEWRFLPDDLKAEMIKRRDRYEAHFRQAIQQGVDESVFKTDDVKVATLFVLSALNWSYQWMKQDGPKALPELIDYYSSLIMQSLNYKA